MKRYELVRSINCVEHIQVVAANILSSQWPEGGGYSKRLSDLKTSTRSYILLEWTEDETHSVTVGHAEVKPAVMTSANDTIGCQVNNAILVSVVIDPQKRGCGIGNILMLKIESISLDLGYAYIYLWTSDAVNFYKKLQYTECESSLVDVPVFKEFDVSKLQNLFMKRLTINDNNSSSSSFSSLSKVPPVWLRKRIAYEFPLEFVSYHKDVEFSLRQVITMSSKSNNQNNTVIHNTFDNIDSNNNYDSTTASAATVPHNKNAKQTTMDVLYIPNFPLCRQIGPSCGIAALTMLIGYHSYLATLKLQKGNHDDIGNNLNQNSNRSNIHSNDKITTIPVTNSTTSSADKILSSSTPKSTSSLLNQSKALLQTAIEKGYSSDGEMFNIHHLAELYLHVIENKPHMYLYNYNDVNTATNSGLMINLNAAENTSYTADQCKCDVKVCDTRSILNPAYLKQLFDPIAMTTNTNDTININSDIKSSNDNNGNKDASSAKLEEKTITPPIIHRHIILPYDRDASHHTPCLANGHKAHYCVVIGYGHRSYIQQQQVSSTYNQPSNLSSSLFQYVSLSSGISTVKVRDIDFKIKDDIDSFDNNSPSNHNITVDNSDDVYSNNNNHTNNNNNNNYTNTNNTDNDNADDYYLLCVHGMSLKPVVAPLQQWIDSNAQLHQAKQTGNASHWKVNDSGPQLSHKCLLVSFTL